ncbi:MAG: hypothetical protein WCV85_06380 [Patescibacteria group bacterium]|jgi:hypothetical protein
MSEMLTFADFLVEVQNAMADVNRKPFGHILQRRLESLRLTVSPTFGAPNGNGLCLARFLDTRRGIYAGLVTNLQLLPDCLRVDMYGPERMQLDVPYDVLVWFSVEGRNVHGVYTIHDGVLVKDEPIVDAEGAASEGSPPNPIEA